MQKIIEDQSSTLIGKIFLTFVGILIMIILIMLDQPLRNEIRAWSQVCVSASIPIAIAWYNHQEQRRRQEDMAKREEIAQQEQKEKREQTALTAYIDQISSLLVRDNLNLSNEHDSTLNIARALTAKILREVDVEKKNQVFNLLASLDLIGKNESISLFRHINLCNVDMTGVDAKGVDFSGAKLNGTVFTNANLTNTKFQDSELQNSIFKQANLRFSSFKSAYLDKSNFSRAVMEKVNLEQAHLYSVDFSDCDLFQAKFSLGQTIFECNFSNANLISSALAYTCIVNGSMRDVSLESADLFRAKFCQVKLTQNLGKEQQEKLEVYQPIIIEP